MLSHRLSTPETYGLEPNVPGPYWYGLMWWLIISPWAAYENTSRLKSGATTSSGTIQRASM